jgi:two-component system chemotaxis response regulator CheB
VIAVVLTGSGTDGATGSEVVYACGGVTLVEDPATAQAASMPTAALRRDDPEAVLPLADIAGKLVELTARDSAPSPPVWWEPEPLRQPSGAGSRSPDPGRGVRVR